MKLTTRALVLATASVAAPAMAQDGGAASISTGAAYSSQRGAVAFVTLDGRDIMGSGVDLRFSYEAGKDDEAAELRLRKVWQLGQTSLGANSFVALTLGAEKSDISAQQFSLTQYALDLTFGADLAPAARYSVSLFHLDDDLEAAGADVSPLISAENGKTTATGLAVDLTYSTYDRETLPQSGFKLGGTVAATFAGDRDWASAAVNAGLAHPIGTATLALRAEAGVINGRGGQAVSILDRAYLGGDAPRGFAFAGIGPRDVTAGGVDSALGGNRYVTASVEVRAPTRMENLTLGAFVDAGSVWDLDVTAGGASGVIDDAYSLRSAAGLSAYWQTGIGLVQVNLATPLARESYDKDEVFSIGLSARF
jgi:outer membrane protein assembly factor BamA